MSDDRFYDPLEREREKQRRREQDDRDLAADHVSKEELGAETAFSPRSISLAPGSSVEVESAEEHASHRLVLRSQVWRSLSLRGERRVAVS